MSAAAGEEKPSNEDPLVKRLKEAVEREKSWPTR